MSDGTFSEIVNKTCCPGCDHTKNRYYNDTREFGIIRCRCFDDGRSPRDLHFKGCPFEKSNGNPHHEDIEVAPETIGFIWENILQQFMECFDVTLEAMPKQQWTYKRYQRSGKCRRPIIRVTGTVVEYDNVTFAIQAIEGIDSSILEQRKNKAFEGRDWRTPIITMGVTLGVTLESPDDTKASVKKFRKHVHRTIFQGSPGANICLVSTSADDDWTPGLSHFTVSGNPEDVELACWNMKMLEAQCRKFHEETERKKNPPACRLCEHTAEQCYKMREGEDPWEHDSEDPWEHDSEPTPLRKHLPPSLLVTTKPVSQSRSFNPASYTPYSCQ